jgi:hypothetical protein
VTVSDPPSDCARVTSKPEIDRNKADFSLPILIATWKFLDSEAFEQDWQDLLVAKQMYPYDSKGPAETCARVRILISPSCKRSAGS